MGNRGRSPRGTDYPQIEHQESKHLFDKSLTRKEKAEAFRFLAAKNLSKRGFHPFFEVCLDIAPYDSENFHYLNYLWGRRADILAIKELDEITIVEVKSSVSDFNTDGKWSDYLKACDRFYFCSDAKTIEHIDQSIKGHECQKKIGLMTCDLESMTLRITKPSRSDESLEIPELVRKQIMYKALVSADVFLAGQYSARLKPAYSYIDIPYA